MIFEAPELMIKNPDGEIIPYRPTNRETLFIDGSIGGDLPMQRMSELFNVNTFIVSQVNPHVIPFVSTDGGGVLESRMRAKFTRTLKTVIGNETKHWLTQMSALGLIPEGMKQLTGIVTQSYKGHVTLVPKADIKSYFKLMVNPSFEDFKLATNVSFATTLSSIKLI